ncbi:DUF6526 family protein [Mesoterricola sediminis]|uniref:Uncharacterized protein n=1 Tax=Mesoterricola sediminis TaxID=2927980 RepID=A0AA48GY29_9BACT|nr:DUF6526 family protein [Mesoterricola sediminis]BDU76142.1 hypothetical protein METESE_11000 [Mesoterricola sediminis]
MSQTYETHRRMDPLYHYGATVLWLLLAASVVRHVLQQRPGSWTELVLVAFLFILFWKVRGNPLRVQDRLIRLEETLRMKALLPAEQQPDIARLTPAQFVALRFASDGELADRVREAVAEQLGAEAIKKRIQTWRADEFRV